MRSSTLKGENKQKRDNGYRKATFKGLRRDNFQIAVMLDANLPGVQQPKCYIYVGMSLNSYINVGHASTLPALHLCYIFVERYMRQLIP